MRRASGGPNGVYQRTHAGLSGLVPSRAARRILDAGLVSERRSASSISADEMARVLLGPVLRDLTAVLPAAGVQRELEVLVRSLRPPARPASRVTPVVVERPPADVGLIGTSDVPTPLPPPPRPRTLPDDHEVVLGALAPLDGVAGVAVFDARGCTVNVRGDLPDPGALGPVLAAGGELLNRHGAMRTVCVGTTTGMLVAVPVPPRWVAVSGRCDLNLGAVYAALGALEEER